MFTKKSFILIIIALIVGVLASCKYEKLLKSSDYRLKYRKAIEYYQEEDFSRAIGLLEQLNPVMKATDRADTVLYYLANCYYEVGDYILGGHHFKEFYRTFGNHKWAENAEFMTAYCDYQLSPRPELDQSNTKKAITGFRLFIQRHPNNPKVSQANDIIIELRNKLAKKDYLGAKLYYDMEDYKAAIVAFENSLQQFPNSKYREKIKYYLLQSKFTYASRSIKEKEEERFQETLDEYYTFVSEFPESEYKDDAEKIFEKTQKNLKN